MREIKIILLIIGTIIGAGTVSGKEVAAFFSIYGVYSFIFILPLFFLLFYFINKLLILGSNNKINNTSELNYLIFKNNNKLIKVFTFVSFLIISATMFSGITTSFNLTNMSFVYFLILLLLTIFVSLIVHKDIKSITNLCGLVIPIIVIVIIYVCISNSSFITETFTPQNIILLPFNVITYVCRNIFLSYFVVTKSAYNLTFAQCKRISFLSSFIICLIITLTIICELSNINIISQSMPLLYITQTSNLLYIIYFLCLQFAIITTLTSTLLTIKSFFNFKTKFFNTLIPTSICALLSIVKFEIFVTYLYPIIGMFGLYLISYLISPKFLFQNSNKNIHKTCN